MKKLISSLMALFVMGLVLLPAGASLAAVGDDCTANADCDSGERCVSEFCEVITTGDDLTADDLGIGYAGATGLGNEPIQTTIASIIKVAMGLLGIVAVVIILIGGFTWMTAGGNDEKVGEAKKWIFSGVIGLAIILSAYALASFVIDNLVNATTGVL